MAWHEYACAHCRRLFRCEAGPQPSHARCPSCQGLVGIPAAGRWYYARGRQKLGPLVLDGLRKLAASGRLTRSDMVWQEGTPVWLPAGSVPGLFAVPVLALAPRKQRRRAWTAVALGLMIATAALAVLTWCTSGPGAHGDSRRTATAEAEPELEMLPAPKEAESPVLPSEQPQCPAPPPPEAPISQPTLPKAEQPTGAAPCAERPLLCPADGQTDVPLAFSGGPEIPGSLPGQAGYPVSVTFRPGVCVRGVAARLLDGAGRQVDVRLLTPETDPQGQRNSVCLIARAPLRPATRYRVEVRARVGGEEWAREWTFTTAKADPVHAAVAARALEKVNAYRARAGLEAVILDPQLTAGCQAHCDYLARNAGHPSTEGLGAHSEDPALPGYSEGGSLAGKSSVIAWGEAEPLATIDGWMATLYHRVPLLDPTLKRIGFGHARRRGGWVTALDVMRGKEASPPAGVVLYPAPNQAGVPLRFPANEDPDPIPLATDRRAGFPITTTFPAGASLTKMAFTLKDGGGQTVAVWFSSPEKPANPKFAAHQGTTVCLIAREPLRPETTYTVSGSGEVNGLPWSREWSFTTGKGADPVRMAAEVLTRVNAYRRAAGLPQVELDPSLSKGCAAHAGYIARNAGHPALQGDGILNEDPALPGYTAEGFAAARGGDVCTGLPDPREQVDRMMATLLRRLNLLDPALRRIGFGCAEEPAGGWVGVLDLFRGRTPGAAAF